MLMRSPKDVVRLDKQGDIITLLEERIKKVNKGLKLKKFRIFCLPGSQICIEQLSLFGLVFLKSLYRIVAEIEVSSFGGVYVKTNGFFPSRSLKKLISGI